MLVFGKKMLYLCIRKRKQQINTMKTQETQNINECASCVFDEEEVFDLDMQLSPHFKLKEFVRSAKAIELGIDNMPAAEEVARLQALANALEPLREAMGAIRITSGYRCYRVNEAVGGSRTSQHLKGEACDIYCGSTEIGRKYYNFIVENLDFDQLLLEFKGGKHPRIHCLHISYRVGNNRRQCKSYYPVK